VQAALSAGLLRYTVLIAQAVLSSPHNSCVSRDLYHRGQLSDDAEEGLTSLLLLLQMAPLSHLVFALDFPGVRYFARMSVCLAVCNAAVLQSNAALAALVAVSMVQEYLHVLEG
jgi:hypothetical protein